MTDQLSDEEVKNRLAVLVPALRAKRRLLKPVVDQLRAESKIYAPKGETREHRYIASLTHSPWGSKVATTFAQELNVSGYLTDDASPENNDPAWSLWDRGRMRLVQDIVIREAFEYGASFAAALPTDVAGSAVAKPLPPFHTVAWYEDPVIDVWPIAVLTTSADRKTTTPANGTLYVGDWVYPLTFPDGLDESTVKVGTAWQHNALDTPVVRFPNEIDSLGNTVGKVAPLLPLLERIRKDTYDRTLVQHKHGWKVRTISGMADELESDAEKAAEKLRLAVEDILVSSDPQAKFGTLDESPLGDMISAKESDVYELCALAPIPPSALMPGKIANVSAEAIAELRNGFENRIADHKEVLGESFDWLMRALAVQAGFPVNLDAHVRWQDRSVRSLAQAGDAWGKLIPALEIPPEGVWDRVPGVTAADRERWSSMRKRQQGQQTLAAILQPTAPPTA